MISSLLISKLSWSQDTYYPIYSNEVQLIERLQTKNKTFSPHQSTLSQPLSKKEAAIYIQSLFDQLKSEQSGLSEIDRYNVSQLIGVNGEHFIQANGMDMMQRSKKPILKYFYTSTGHLYHVDQQDFFLTVNPVLRTELGYEQSQERKPFKNLRGAEVRGHIGDRIGFYSMLGDNQELGFNHIVQWENQYKSAPGYDYYRLLDNKSTDAFLGRAYVDITAIPKHLNITFGYDKHFIGSGIRSLILSDFAAPSTFLKLKSKYKRFTYENLIVELVGTFKGLGNDARLPRKYGTFHQLNYNIKPWLQLGITESTIFGAEDKFNIGNIIPIIGYQSVASSLGAKQKTNWGINFKMLPVPNLQVYGQATLDYVKQDHNAKNSRYAAQLGLKYYDAFTIPNLDIQVEGNYATPFMYTASDSIQSYTHYNQPLAHPLGAGFTEGIVNIQYQPAKKFFIDLQAIYAIRNEAPFINNAGTFILMPNTLSQYIFPNNTFMQHGDRNDLMVNLNIAYEIIPKLFIEVGGGYNRFTQQSIATAQAYATGGLRWNIGRRLYNYNY